MQKKQKKKLFLSSIFYDNYKKEKTIEKNIYLIRL